MSVSATTTFTFDPNNWGTSFWNWSTGYMEPQIAGALSTDGGNTWVICGTMPGANGASMWFQSTPGGGWIYSGYSQGGQTFPSGNSYPSAGPIPGLNQSGSTNDGMGDITVPAANVPTSIVPDAKYSHGEPAPNGVGPLGGYGLLGGTRIALTSGGTGTCTRIGCPQ